jgi:hypothetical protein
MGSSEEHFNRTPEQGAAATDAAVNARARPAEPVGPGGPGRPYRREPREDTSPRTVIDLLDRLWVSLDWSGAGQIAIILVALGVAAVLVFGGSALAAHVLIGASPWLSGVGAAVAGVGASTGEASTAGLGRYGRIAVISASSVTARPEACRRVCVRQVARADGGQAPPLPTRCGSRSLILAARPGPADRAKGSHQGRPGPDPGMQSRDQ